MMKTLVGLLVVLVGGMLLTLMAIGRQVERISYDACTARGGAMEYVAVDHDTNRQVCAWRAPPDRVLR